MSGNTAAPSTSDSARRDEAAKERERINAENQKISNANEVVSRTFKAGNEAFNAGRYDEAIAAYSEGIAAREEIALYTNRSEALRRRGVERYNAAIRNKDAEAKRAALETAFKDWREAADSAQQAVALSNTQPAATDMAAAANQTQNKLAALSTRAEALRLVASKADKSQLDNAIAAYNEYMAATLDPFKKSKLETDVAKLLFDAGDYERAVEAYRKIIAANPDNAGANLYLGFSLFNMGDKAKFQEAANYIAAFIEKAPDTDPTKAEAQTILDFLKTQENIEPGKVQPARSGRRRP